jgi:CheY-like chemotaxis protein
MISTDDGYILVLDPEHREIRNIRSIETDLQYPVFVASSTEQAVTRLHQGMPCLVILVGNNVQDWSQPLVQYLRQATHTADMTIVALTDSASPHWNHSEDTPELDGFLVKPLSLDIVKSLVESAYARQAWQGLIEQ